MLLSVKPGSLNGSVAVPGSKSHTIRALCAGLLADGTSRIDCPLRSADTLSVLAAIRLLGATVEEDPAGWTVNGVGKKLQNPHALIDLGNSGTGLRFISAIAGLGDFLVNLDGDASLRTRPMESLLDALGNLGVQCRSQGGFAPISLRGPIKGGPTRVSGVSSQFLSALLFALPLADADSELTLDELNESPYVVMTLDWLRRLGIKYKADEDLLHFELPGGQEFKPFCRVIPADFSTAAFPLAAGLIAGTEVKILNLDFADTQGDKAVFQLFEQMGATLEYQQNQVVVRGPQKLHGGEFDLNLTPDALPIVAAVAATLENEETRLVNVPQARLKETDRIAAMAQILTQFGAKVKELSDGLVIHGVKSQGGCVIDSRGDHRLAMAAAILGLVANGETVVEKCECTKVTYPDFVANFQNLGAAFTESSEQL